VLVEFDGKAARTPNVLFRKCPLVICLLEYLFFPPVNPQAQTKIIFLHHKWAVSPSGLTLYLMPNSTWPFLLHSISRTQRHHNSSNARNIFLILNHAQMVLEGVLNWDWEQVAQVAHVSAHLVC